MSKKGIALSFIIFSFGAVAQLGLDLYLSIRLDENLLSSWAYFKSFSLTGITFVLLGSSQVIVRVQKEPKDILPIILCQYLGISTLISVFGVFFFDIEVDFLILFAIVILLSINQFFYGYFQSKKEFKDSQLIFGSWRILFFIFTLILVETFLSKGISFGIIEISYLFLIALLIPIFILIVFKKTITEAFKGLSKHSLKSIKQGFKENAEFYSLGMMFFLFSLTATISAYFDQLFLGYVNAKSELAIYFVHLTVILTPITFLNKFVGFILAPYIRQMKSKKIDQKLFFRYIFLIFSALIVVLIILYFASAFLFKFIYADKYEFMPLVSIGVICIGYLRTIYLIPSSFLGMLGSQSILTRFLILNLSGGGLQFIVMYVGYLQGYNIIFVVIVGTIVNWLFRSLGGVLQTLRLKELKN